MKRSIEKDHGHRRNPANVLSLSGTMNHAGQPGSSLRMIIRQRLPPTRSKGIWDEESWDALAKLGAAEAAENIQ